MKTYTKRILAIIMTVALVFSAVAVTGAFAVDKPTFSLNRVSETDSQVVISINLESGSFNSATFSIATNSNISACSAIGFGDTLRSYIADLDGIGESRNPLLAKATIASATTLSNKGAYFVFTFTKKTSARVVASDFELTEHDITEGVNINNNIPVKYSKDCLTFSVSGSTATITGCRKDVFGTALLPSSYNGKSVVAIADGAFSGCTDIDSITIPSTITKVGKKAFENCSGMKSINIAKQVNTIGEDAFIGCTGLENANYSGMLADWCAVNLANKNANPNTVAKTFKISGNEIKGELVIPSTVTSIGKNTFAGFKGITKLTLSEATASVGENAFNGCTGITTVIIPAATTSIANNAFAGCSKLATVGYKSSQDNWKKVTIGSGNDALKNAAITYFYGHKHEYKVVKSVKVTCTIDGYNEYKCTMCDDGYTADVVKAPGHKSATWKYDNDKHWQICDGCGITINSAKHAFDANGGCKCGYITAIKGDLNNDKVINSKDALILLQSVVGQINLNSTQKALADINKDSKCDSSDALLILQFTVGVINKL